MVLLLVLDWGFGRRSAWLVLLIMLRLGESFLGLLCSSVPRTCIDANYFIQGQELAEEIRTSSIGDRERSEFEPFQLSFLPFASSCAVYYIYLLVHLLIPDRNEVKVRSYRPYPGTDGDGSSNCLFVLLPPDPSRL